MYLYDIYLCEFQVRNYSLLINSYVLLHVQHKTQVAENFTTVDLAVHNQSAKVFSAKIFYSSWLMGQAAKLSTNVFLPKYFWAAGIPRIPVLQKNYGMLCSPDLFSLPTIKRKKRSGYATLTFRRRIKDTNSQDSVWIEGSP